MKPQISTVALTFFDEALGVGKTPPVWKALMFVGMAQLRFVLILLAATMAGFAFMLNTGCANIIPPQGGPRDTLPPRLLSVTPDDSTLNFNSRRIVFNFDEYIADPQDLTKNLTFNPTFEINPEIAIRSRTVTLTLSSRDTLLPNTTYTLAFGEAIRDINENNILRNLTYVFSTGPVLDSLSLSGNVKIAETGRTDSTLIVILHRNLADSAVVNQRPIYVARVDGSGNFRFQNLPQGRFSIYALGNPSILRRYNSREFFAFSDSVVVTGVTGSVNLNAYKPEAATPPTSTATAPQRGAATTADKRLRFTAVPTGSKLDLSADYVLAFQSGLRTFDSSLVSLSVDTTYTPVNYTARLDSSRTSLRFRSTWREGGVYNLILARDFAEDSAGRKLLKSDTLNFTVKSQSDYGQVAIRLRNVDESRRPVLLFVQGDQVVFSAPLQGGIYRSRLFTPAEYDLRILYDANGNGKWDGGQFFGTKRQPETVVPIPRKINVRAGWDNDYDISL